LMRQLLREPARLIHCHSMQRMASMARVAAKLKQIPYVMSLHGGQYTVPQCEISDMAKSTRHSLNYGRLLDIFTRPNRALNDASGIICVGFDEYQAVKKHFPFKPTIYLPNGVHCQAFSDGDGQAFRQKYQIDAKKQLILCVSRIDPQKNQLALVDLLEQLVRSQGHKQGFHLLLVGPVTNSGYCQQIQQAIAHRGLDQDFTLIPGLPPGSKMLANVYRAADVFILPSVHEPFGIVVLEAWAAELPVIAASVGGLNQLISDNQTGLHFSPFNQRSLLDAFMRLQQEPKLKHRIASNGAKEACQHYSWQNYIQRLQKFYDDVESWHRSHTLTTVHL
ncbi:MAG: glycosyltransferase family 4 protein, partial [Pseudomonadales bacterium]|nr:glycosyltransferase family 4 protein [Pseudomonadales bacterium]